MALLRGINVGGRNKLAMGDLRAMFTAVGCADVRTYIQSGNVVFSATAALAKRTPNLISQRIADDFGYRVPVVLRSADEFVHVVESNPFRKSGASDEALHVAFLADAPDPRRAAALDPHRSPGDSFAVRGRDIYLHLPHGVADSKLTNAYFDSALATTSTVRNWRTVMKLFEMTNTP